VLRQEDVKIQLMSFQRSTGAPPISAQEIEQAVIERLQAEEESAEIQDMIARFYNKFDELHE
jgi:ubiquinone biosynthesis protein COQ9